MAWTSICSDACLQRGHNYRVYVNRIINDEPDSEVGLPVSEDVIVSTGVESEAVVRGLADEVLSVGLDPIVVKLLAKD